MSRSGLRNQIDKYRGRSHFQSRIGLGCFGAKVAECFWEVDLGLLTQLLNLNIKVKYHRDTKHNKLDMFSLSTSALVYYLRARLEPTWVKPKRTPLSCWAPSLLTNIKLKRKWLTVINTLAYSYAVSITALKSVIEHIQESLVCCSFEKFVEFWSKIIFGLDSK